MLMTVLTPSPRVHVKIQEAGASGAQTALLEGGQ